MEVQQRINDYWDIRSESYDASPGHGLGSDAEYTAWLNALTGLLPQPPGDLLDVGTGTGFLALLAAELGFTATGVDLSEGMLGLAQAKADGRANPRFLPGDALAPPFSPQSFDAIVSRHVLWTLRDPALALRNWFELLRPGATVLAIDGLWKQSTSEDTPVGDAWSQYYSEATRSALPLMSVSSLDRIRTLFETAGFVDIAVHTLAAVEEVEPREEGQEPRYAIVGRRPA